MNFRNLLLLYYLVAVGCMANFGVVPLIRFCALRSAPTFLRFLALLLSVTLVLEAIIKLLSFNDKNDPGKRVFVTSPILSVKLFAIIPIITIAFWPVHSWALDNGQTQNDIVISIGEHYELPLPNMKKFTIGNHEVLSHKLTEQKRLIIKGIKLGYSELVVWEQAGTKQEFQVYILSKEKQLKLSHYLQTLHNFNIDATLSGPLIVIRGTISSLSQLKIIRQLTNKAPDIFHLAAHFNQALRNEIIGDIYKQFYEQYIDHIICEDNLLDINCRYTDTNDVDEKFLSIISQKYGANLVKMASNVADKKYLLRLKIIQMEKMNGEELGLGLDSMSGQLSDLFTGGLTSLLKNNSLLLEEQAVDMSTLAEPEIVIIPGKEVEIEVGGDIPLAINNPDDNDKRVLFFKFAGIKIKIKIEKHNDKFMANYKTEFSRPGENNDSVTGNKESSAALVAKGTPLQLFQIGFKTVDNATRSLPLINKIPLIRTIFSSKSGHSNHKKISGIILLEEYEI
ncbi:MAG: hypothetical protein A2504_09225 [Bdellovibrionales bacterium RIFOXYD12_FULL_39_22]|nr:MAG: hypothetical protein A2385_17325 [Bdellovibrionales bacterium RIFOXYB1_FULL_39_21]OFZ41077.1 MAG: hypothetical protein A2485_00250 [Bdellovibrionales bacterium RIFOXYC12_FULL_39_17]OFZ50290.1 MAG: hypothetical protein A2404_07565 [Bdellovibrionales bacterium RIFOXYC1_FULL_39_130]OFZ71822.1 MAG: hypothetical protein A2451_09650 [Bdellovibrionales bacterium RIFOXYC2_FULL_39_8]OFZ75091.1 MAG: hypothetical protein A2560_16260 [Bdellovibrionales bacterium RIFOXYD1_FULL_39_84]OFZ92267.1 MAG: